MKKFLSSFCLALAAIAQPVSGAVTPTLPTEPVFPENPQIFNVTDYGAVGDGTTDDTQSVQAAIDACAEANNGGTVLLSGNGKTYLTKMVTLKSNMTFKIDEGATIKCTDRRDDFPPCVIDSKNGNWGTGGNEYARAFIYAYKADNLRITGPGIINGNGYAANYDASHRELERPIPIYLVGCQKVLLDDFRLDDGAMWDIVPMETDDLTMRNVSINSNIMVNRDGIDLVDCHRVLIEKCTFYTDDDCICPKSGHTRGVQDVTVRDCDLTISGRANGIKFGTKSYGCFKRMLFHNIRMKNIKLAGIAVEAVDGADIEDVEFRDIDMDGVGIPIFVILGDRGETMWGGEHRMGSIKNILFKDITAVNTRMDLGCIVSGTKKNGTTYKVENLTFDHLTMTFPGGKTLAPSMPGEYNGGYPESNMWGATPASGFFVRHASGVTFKDCDFTVTPSDARNFIVASDADVTRENVTVTVIKKDNVANAFTFAGSEPALASDNTYWLWDSDTKEGIGFNSERGYIEYDLSKHYQTPVRLTQAALWQDASGAHVDRWQVQYRGEGETGWTDAMPMQECKTEGWQYADIDVNAAAIRLFVECDEYDNPYTGRQPGRANLHEFAVYSPDATEINSSTFTEGDGTPESPYMIENPGQLNSMRNFPDAHFRLAADIDLADWLENTSTATGWIPVGDGANAFTGSLNGDGHSINGLWSNFSGDNIGLFGVAENASITNLVINLSPKGIKGENNVAAMVGYGSARFQKCAVTGTITASKKNAAAFIAQVNKVANSDFTASVNQCYANATITGNDGAGGIFGAVIINHNAVHSISESYVIGTVSGGTGTSGGIVAAISSDDANVKTPVISIKNSFALQQSVNSGYALKRILGYVNKNTTFAQGAVLENNHALSSMAISKYTAGSGMDNNNNGADVMIETLNTPATYAGWDFEGIWVMGTADYRLPKFRNASGQPTAMPDYLSLIPTGIDTIVPGTSEAAVTYDRALNIISAVKSPGAQINVISVSGATVASTHNAALSIAHLPDGIYLVQLGNIVKKIVK